jgi:hypothetical protein
VSSLNVSGASTFNNASTCLSTLNVVGKTTVLDCQIQGIATFPVNNWIIDSNTTNNQRIYFDSGAKTYFKSAGTTASPALDGFIFRNGQAGADLLNIDGSANISCLGTLNVSGTATLYNYLTVYNGNTSYGYVTLVGGANTQPGYIAFYKPGGTRVGYVGWRQDFGTSSYLLLETENGYTGYNMTGNFIVNGSVGIGASPTTNLDIYGPTPKLTLRGAYSTDIATFYLGTPSPGFSTCKCALIAEGVGSFSRSKLHICLNNTNDSNAIYTASINDNCATFHYNGNVGIGNTNPLDDGGATTYFCVGDSSMAYSEGAIVIGKKDGSGGTRQYKFGITTGFYWGIGDFGNSNTIPTSWSTQIICHYVAPTNSLLIDSIGRVYGNFINTSDERIKTDIQTIDNALDKVLLLRGVNYTVITENTREIGLIAQEVEHIIPEAVKENELTHLKAINYSGLVGLLVEAIKDQQVGNNNK